MFMFMYMFMFSYKEYTRQTINSERFFMFTNKGKQIRIE